MSKKITTFAVEFPKERKDIAIIMKKQYIHSIYSTTSLDEGETDYTHIHVRAIYIIRWRARR